MMRLARVALAALAAVGGFVLPSAPSGGRLAGAEVERPFPTLTPPALAERYAQSRQAIAGAARGAGDGATARRLAALAAPGRQFLAFDGHHAVEVVGDLTTARRVAILVPGADTTQATFDSRGTASPGEGSRALLAEARRLDPRSGLAMIAWLGYEPPHTLSVDVATTRRADDGARELRRLVGWLDRRVAISLLCHSYGSVVCARAANELDVTDIAVFGSPGMTVSSARDLHTRARVWAGRAGGDWTAYIPKVHFLGVGFRGDPVARSFGARRFSTGDGGHSDYLEPGVSLRNLALIALGRDSEVTS